MLILLYLLIAIVVIGLIVLSSTKPEYRVSRSRTIDAPAEAIFSQIKDFRRWPAWSPWLLHEPGCHIDYSQNPPPDQTGGSYQWSGSLVGEGRVEHIAQTPNASLEQKITFLRPMKSSSDISWTLETQANGRTKVSWSMSGAMPFLFRPMAKKMDNFIGPDYELGLALLARESGDQRAGISLEFSENISEQAQGYIAVPYNGPIADLPVVMPKAFKTLQDLVSKNAIAVTGESFALYHKIDKAKSAVESHICFAVDINSAEVLAAKSDLQQEGVVISTMPAYQASRLTLVGSYQHLSYVWPCAYSHIRMTKSRPNKKLPVVERYLKAEVADCIEKSTPTICLDIPLS